MTELGKSIYPVFGICFIGLCLVVGFGIKELRFSFYLRRAKKSYEKADFRSALRYLLLAEKLWMLRASKQSMSSRAEDCRNLAIILELIDKASEHCSIRVDTAEYRKTANKLEEFFSNKTKSGRVYAEIHSKLVNKRKQFRREVEQLAV